METKNTDYFEDIAFHPSLDIKNGILVLGFRRKPEINKEEEIFLVVSKDNIQMVNKTSFTFNDKTYDIDLGKRKLSKLSKMWGIDKIDKTYEHLCKEWRPLVNSLEVFNKLKELLKDYVDIDDPDYILIVTWALGTYFFPIFSAYPYLHIKAPKGSGKTQCLSFLKQTCFNAVKARASLPALRDTVDALRGTYLMDQADSLHRPNNEELLDILTDSYKRGGGDQRKMIQDKGRNWSTQEFQTYSPKALASISQLPEDLRDRCLLIALTKSKKNFKSLDEENNVWKEMRGDIYKLLISTHTDVCLQYELKKIEYGLTPTLIGRQLELWLPLEVLMTVIGISQDEQKSAKAKFKSQYRFTESQPSELDRAVIETILEIVIDKMEIILSPKEIAEKIDSSIYEDDKNGFSLNGKQRAVQVGKIINKFNLSSQKLPRSNKGERYLFKKEQVEKVSGGYLNLETVDEPTPTYTEQKEPIKLDDIW